jgi:hypothetical protein
VSGTLVLGPSCCSSPHPHDKLKGDDQGPALPSPPDSSEKPPAAPLSATISRSLQIVRAIKRGYPPDERWIGLHLQRGDYGSLIELLEGEDLLGYVQDKIRWASGAPFRYRQDEADFDPMDVRLINALTLSSLYPA